MKTRLAAVAAMLSVTACSGPIVGGPCRYETAQFDATVMGTANGQVTLAGPGSDTFEMPESAFEAAPAAGDIVRIEKDTIVKGTCTPEMVRVAG